MKIEITRQIFLDTETTGINQTNEPYRGHKIIEIGAIEIINRRPTGNNFHVYLKPDRPVDLKAFDVHGISDEFLLDKPCFQEIANDFLNYIHNAELIIHNASFDIGFINYEFSKLDRYFPKIDMFCKVTDSLALARKIFPNKNNSLDALCSRYEIDNSKRKLHGALLDAQILADIYLAMTSGQMSILFNTAEENQEKKNASIHNATRKTSKLRIIRANHKELIEHESYLSLLQKKSNNCLWHSYSSKLDSQ